MSEYDKVANELTNMIWRLNSGWSDRYRLEIAVTAKARQLNNIRPSRLASEIIKSMERLMDDMGAVVDAADDLDKEVNGNE